MRLKKNEYPAAVEWNVLYMLVSSICSQSSVQVQHFLVDFLSGCSINYREVLMSSTIIVLLPISPFSYVNAYFLYLGALMFMHI